MNENDVKELIEDVQVRPDYIARQMMDKVVNSVVFNADFTGRLYDALSLNVPKTKKRKLLVNLAKAKIRDKINQVGSLPDIRVYDPVGLDVPEDAPFWAEFVKRIIFSHWRQNQVDLMLWDVAMGMSLYGRCPIQVFPDFENKRAIIHAPHPSSVYAEAKLENRNAYEYVLYINELPGRSILRLYPSASACEVTNTKDLFKLVEYWDDNYRYLFANGKKIPGKGINHSLGFNPNRIIPNAVHDPWGVSIDGVSDIYQEIPLLENLNEMLLMGTEERRKSLKKHLIIEDAVNVPEGIENLEASVIEVAKGGRVYYASQVDNPSSTALDISFQEELFRKVSNFPPQMSGYPASSGTVTGKGWTASLTGVSQDAATTQILIGRNMVKINEYSLKMEKLLFGKVKKESRGKFPEYFAKGANEDFVFHYQPEDIPDDFIHELEFYALGIDIPTRIVNLLQLYGQGIISAQTVQEKVPGIDSAEELRRLEVDQKRKMKMMQMAQFLGGAQGQTPESTEEAVLAMEKGRV